MTTKALVRTGRVELPCPCGRWNLNPQQRTREHSLASICRGSATIQRRIPALPDSPEQPQKQPHSGDLLITNENQRLRHANTRNEIGVFGDTGTRHPALLGHKVSTKVDTVAPGHFRTRAAVRP